MRAIGNMYIQSWTVCFRGVLCEIKESSYLTKRLTNYNYGYMKGRKEGNVLFNDSLHTFYLRLYSVVHMVKDRSDSCRHMGYSFRLAARVSLT